MLYIIITLLIILYILKKELIETFTSYKICDLKKKPHGITSEIFNENEITKNNDDFEVYMPCGYNKVENELLNINLENKKIYALKGCDKIVSKNNLWTILETDYGRDIAKTIMPETFLYNDNDIELFKKNYKGQSYILKSNKQRKKGITISDNLGTILNKNNNNKLIQEFKESFIINKRKFNLRIYFLIVCKNNAKKVYVHKNTKCLYTSKNFDNNKLDFDSNITNSYKTNKDIYDTNPFSLEELYDYLKPTYDTEKLKGKINKIILLFSKAIVKPLCNLNKLKKNTNFQLFGIDMLIDKNMDPYILEVNKGPDMIPKDEKDKRFKKIVLEDIFEKLKIIKTERSNLFKRINIE